MEPSRSMDLNDLLQDAVNAGATDVHLKLGRPPILRYDGTLKPLESWSPVTPADLESVLKTVTAVNRQKEADFRATGELDIAYTANDLARYRVNGFLQRGTISFAFRIIPKQVPTFETLRMPPGVRRLADEQHGLAREVAAPAARSHHDFAIALEQALKAKAAEERLTADQPALPTLRS